MYGGYFVDQKLNITGSIFEQVYGVTDMVKRGIVQNSFDIGLDSLTAFSHYKWVGIMHPVINDILSLDI